MQNSRSGQWKQRWHAGLWLSVLFAPVAFALPDYSIVDIGVLPGHIKSEGHRVNSSSEVSGVSIDANGTVYAFRYSDTVGLVDLGPIDPIVGAYNSMGMNDLGDIAATNNASALRYTDATGWQDLGKLNGGTVSYSRAINNRGQVVGFSQTGDRTFHAFRFSDGTGMQDLGLLPGDSNSIGLGINQHGDAVGVSYVLATQVSRAFLAPARGGIRLLGTLGGTKTTAISLNTKQQATGWAYTPGSRKHAVWFRPSGTIKDLGILPGDLQSEGRDINASGKIVGNSYRFGRRSYHPMVWTASRKLEDLNAAGSIRASGWKLRTALSINDNDVIVGTGVNPAGQIRAYRLTPVSAESAQLHCHGHVATIVGTPGDDTIDGTDGDDVILGLGGRDVIRGGGGNDYICGGSGRDRLFGSEGNDTLVGGGGRDLVDGGADEDNCAQGDRARNCEH